jgi:hypothetical protein
VFWYRGNFEPKMEISESFIEHAFIYLNLVRKCKMVLTVAIMLEGVCSGSRVSFQIWESAQIYPEIHKKCRKKKRNGAHCC